MKTRFAPSPTGNVHIGNIRVAIFNWLFARHSNANFLLRVEDTDLERSTPEAIQKMLDAMEWLGLDYDENPLYQTSCREEHIKAAEKMLSQGHAYKPSEDGPMLLRIHEGLFDSSFVSEPREEAEINYEKGELTANYATITHSVTSPKSGETYVTPVNWDTLSSPRFLLENGDEIDAATIRQNCPEDKAIDLNEISGGKIVRLKFIRRYVFFNDLVLGKREKPLDSLRDMVIMRSDGSPVFHIANVVDDIFQGITHILRGNDHVENTYRHLFIYHALGATPPSYGHFPMIVNAQGKPYSKRDGDAYVGDFQSKGILPYALFNFLALCGWAPGDDREIMSKEEMIASFSLERVSASAAQFDLQKLEWMNQQYLMAMPEEKFCSLLKEELNKSGINTEEYDSAWIKTFAATQRERISKISDLMPNTGYFFSAEFEYQEKAVKKNLLKNEGEGLKNLVTIRDVLNSLENWHTEDIEQLLGNFAEKNDLKMGMIAQPLRIACTGNTVSPGIGDTLYLIGKNEVLNRIDRLLGTIKLP